MTHPGSLSSVDPIHPTPSPLPPSLSLHSVQTYAHIVSSRGGEGSSTDPIINLPPFSLVPTSEPPLRLFAKKVACSTTPWVAQTFRQLFYCEACSSDWKLCHTPDQDVTNPTHLPSPPPPPNGQGLTQNLKDTTCKTMLSCIPSCGLKRQQTPWIHEWRPDPTNPCPTYLSDCRARKIWHTRPGVCCHYCTTITSFVFYYLKLSLYQSFDGLPSFMIHA